MDKLLAELYSSGLNISIKNDVTGCKLTTFKSGGMVKTVIEPQDVDALAGLVELLQKIGQNYSLIGNGSNLLISDKGISRPLIKLVKLKDVRMQNNFIYAEAGARLPHLSRLALDNGLTGLEFCCGIPATLGGAVIGNAGAYGREISDLVQYVDILQAGGIKRLYPKDIKFCYRETSLKGKIIVGAMLNLDYEDKEEINLKQTEYTEKRRNTQPQEPSAGSVFKRADGVSPAVYIDQLGLKGVKIGGAEISVKHANFIINNGDATTSDYFNLADFAAEAVYENYAIKLTKEVQLLE